MNWLTQILFLAVTALTLSHGNGLKCYNCNSTTGESHDCQDVKDCGQDVHHCTVVIIVQPEKVVVKGCAPGAPNAFKNGCESYNEFMAKAAKVAESAGGKLKYINADGSACFCDTDLCKPSQADLDSVKNGDHVKTTKGTGSNGKNSGVQILLMLLTGIFLCGFSSYMICSISMFMFW